MRWLLVVLVIAGCGSKKDPAPAAGSGSSLAQVASGAPPVAIDAPSAVAGPDKPPDDASAVDDDPPKVDPTCSEACSKGEDCNAHRCECEDGKVISSRSCVNNCCQDEMATCTSTCDDHDGVKGTWNEQREGGKQTGKACKADDDCASELCYRGYCTRKCSSFGDCPSFWDCEEVGRAREKLCVRR